MLTPLIKTIEVQGFRAFGAEKQVAQTDAPIAVFWGPNSKGKTSLAEALEFLLTGRTVKKELLASRHDEFAGALRHAHLDTATETYVAAALHCPDGKTRLIKRLLTRDYAKQGDCASRLTIDGNPASESDLAALGIVLSQPPLRAPVLAQHTLNYLFTVRPTDRTNYFKALLEVTDLDTFREELAALESYLTPPDDPLLKKLSVIRAIARFEFYFLTKDVTDEDVLRAVFMEVARDILEKEGIDVPATLEERMACIAKRLEENRAKTFPTELFSRSAHTGWNGPSDGNWEDLSKYIEERDKIDEEVRRLTSLFETVLALPQVKDADGALDCPVCETEKALSPSRIAALRANVSSNESFTKAERRARTVLQNMRSVLATYQTNIPKLLPRFVQAGPAARREAGFTVEKLDALLGDSGVKLIGPWLAALRSMIRASRSALTDTNTALKTVAVYAGEPAKLENVQAHKAQLDALSKCASRLAQCDSAYADAVRPLEQALKQVIDKKGDSAGWQELVDLADDVGAVSTALSEYGIYERALREVRTALKQIDDAIEAVLDQKFALLSGAIGEWWSLLRGGEPTFFSGVKRRGRQTIDFKGGLSPHEDQSDPKIRDVIAVFSDSQLHCLGLAIFLARAQQYGTSFVVLDDPVLSSDEDYRSNFRGRVIERLHALGIQTIVLTQQQAMRRDIATLHGHVGVDQYQIDLPSPSTGSEIQKTGDEFSAMLARLGAYTTTDNIEIRRDGGKKLRDATERFCKMVLVKERQANGDATAAISDYEGKMLNGKDGLMVLVTPYLKVDPSHPGKLKTICDDVNPPSHDDDLVPTRQALKEGVGNLKRFQKDYLAS